MGTTASSCIQARCFQSSLSFSLPPVCLMYTVKDLPTLLHLHHPLNLSTQHHLQFSIIILTLARPMLGGYGVNKDPYCHKVEKVIFENKCEPYTEKTCWTQ